MQQKLRDTPNPYSRSAGYSLVKSQTTGRKCLNFMASLIKPKCARSREVAATDVGGDEMLLASSPLSWGHRPVGHAHPPSLPLSVNAAIYVSLARPPAHHLLLLGGPQGGPMA